MEFIEIPCKTEYLSKFIEEITANILSGRISMHYLIK